MRRLAAAAFLALAALVSHPVVHAFTLDLSQSGSATGVVADASHAPGPGEFSMGPSEGAHLKTLGNGLYMDGAFNASWVGSSVALTLDKINNDSFTRTSGTLRLELWAVTTVPARAGAFTGFRLSTFGNIDPLQPRTFYSNLVGTGTMSYPPNGTYWLLLVLTEFSSTNTSCSTQGDGFCQQDSAVASSQTTFGSAPVGNFGNFTDLWWNSSESGWGVNVTHHSSGVAFITWYTYDGAGNPKWYVAPGCRVVSNACTDTLYETSGPPFGPTFNPGAVSVRSVGTISFSFTSLNTGLMSYNVRGSTATKFISRQSF
jgi:hypothetical protein